LNLGLAQVYKEEFSLEESCPKQDAVQNITLAFAEYEKSPQILLLEEIGAKSAYQLGLLYSNCANKLQSKGKKSEAAVQYSLAVEQFQKSKDLSQPHITNNPGWLGLPIFVPPPEKHDVSWHRLRWETLNQIAYVYLSQADLGDTAQCEQVISILTELKEGYSTSSNSMASSTAAQAFYNLGLAYECSGKPDLAIEAYETSLKNSNQGSELASRTRDRLKALGR
jgi:tetratricopeptide (TPR) repeat protein